MFGGWSSIERYLCEAPLRSVIHLIVAAKGAQR